MNSSDWDNRVMAARGKRVILVEGKEDQMVLEPFLSEIVGKDWASQLSVVEAGGRTKVYDPGLRRFPHAWGVVDRDCWTDLEVQQRRQEIPSVFITQGWCMESYFLGSGFLRAFDEQAASVVERERERWVRAGAMWWTLQRTREASERWQKHIQWSDKTFGRPPRVELYLDLSSGAELARSLERLIPADVHQAARLDLGYVAQGFDARLNEVSAWPVDRQWLEGVHGKHALTDLLLPTLRKLRGPIPKARDQDAEWTKRLIQALVRGPLPPPLDELQALALAAPLATSS